MTISIRLDEELAEQLDDAARNSGVSKSELVRQSVEAFLKENSCRAQKAWEEGKEVFGKYSSGRSDVSENADKLIRAMFDAQRRDR